MIQVPGYNHKMQQLIDNYLFGDDETSDTAYDTLKSMGFNGYREYNQQIRRDMIKISNENKAASLAKKPKNYRCS